MLGSDFANADATGMDIVQSSLALGEEVTSRSVRI